MSNLVPNYAIIIPIGEFFKWASAEVKIEFDGENYQTTALDL